MKHQQTPEHDTARDDGGEPRPRTVWGHPLAAAAVCLGTAATIALVAILGQPG